MKLKKLLYLLLICPFLMCCNDEDDIDEIFNSGTWNVANIFERADWNEYNDKGRPVYTKQEDIKLLNNIKVIFEADGTLKGKTPTGEFTGVWQADGKDRSISITQIKASGIQTSFSNKVIEYLRNARFYKGDKNYLKIAPEDTKTYIQFGHFFE